MTVCRRNIALSNILQLLLFFFSLRPEMLSSVIVACFGAFFSPKIEDCNHCDWNSEFKYFSFNGQRRVSVVATWRSPWFVLPLVQFGTGSLVLHLSSLCKHSATVAVKIIQLSEQTREQWQGLSLPTPGLFSGVKANSINLLTVMSDRQFKYYWRNGDIARSR